MRALQDNHFNNSFSQPHPAKAREVFQEDQVGSLADQDSLVEHRDSLVGSQVDQDSLVVVLAASLAVLVEVLVVIPQCQWVRPLPLLPKCNNYLLASHSKVPVV